MFSNNNGPNIPFISSYWEAYVQKGLIPEFRFYNDISETSEFSSFLNSANEISKINENTNISENQNKKILNKANEISNFGNFSTKVAEKFLRILVNIDDSNILKRIASVVEIQELENPNIIQNVDEILNIPNLNKVAFLASAVYAIIEKYSKYIQATDKTSKGNDRLLNSIQDFELSAIFNSLTQLMQTPTPEDLGDNGNPPIPKTKGIGPDEPDEEKNGPPNYPKYDNVPENGKDGAKYRLESVDSKKNTSAGNFKYLTGKEVPATVRANNPSAKAPSHRGKRFFGETSTKVMQNDLDKIFPKLLAFFPKPSNGAGAQSFDFQNFSEFSNINASSFISKFVSLPSGKQSQLKLTENLDKFKTLTGASPDESFDLRDADVAIPALIGLSTILASPYLDKSPFSDKTFEWGFQMALAVSNEMQKRNPRFLSAIRSV